MESAMCRALVLCALCLQHSLLQVLAAYSSPQLLPCFVSCVCDNHTYPQIFCSDDLPFQQRVFELNIFLLNTNAGEKSHVHLQTNSSKLPDILPKLPYLRNLSLAGSRISEVQNSVLKRMRLFELDLSQNVIQTIQDEAFEGLVYLQSLNLSHNNLTNVSKLVFSNLPSLEVLDLDFNQLMYFPLDASSKLPRLKVLRLNNNRLSYLMPGCLLGLYNVNWLGLRGNLLSSFVANVMEEMPSLTDLDVSQNPFHCACGLEGLRGVMSSSSVRLIYPSQTSCFTPLGLRYRLLSDVIFDLGNCTKPNSILSYDLYSVAYIDDIDVSCDIQGEPDPAIMWDTPWSDQFADPAHLSQLETVCTSCKHQRKYRGIGINLDSQVTVLNGGKTLQITHVRSFFSGNITCRAFNFLGNASATRDVKVYSPVRSCIRQSMIMGGLTAAGALCVGLLVGSIKLIVLACRSHFSKDKKVVRTPTGTEDNSEENQSLTQESHCKEDSMDFDDFYPPETPFTTPTTISPTTSPRKDHSPSDGQGTPPGAWLPSNILETMEEVRWRLRFGVGRKMETVKRNVQSIKETSRRNVQSIKESGSVYVHNIMESGSTAANKVKAGVVLGMETVKYHVQSFKEFCGTGDMGTQTISMISVETNLDTNESREVIRSVTFV